MTAHLIDGKAFAAGLGDRIAAGASDFAARTGRAPGLAVVLVGTDPASEIYVRSKGRMARKLGMESFEHRLPADTTQEELLALVAGLNADAAVDGILVQLPLPSPLDSRAVIEAIDPGKDVDGLHPLSAGHLVAGLPGLVSCTPLGCLMLLRETLGSLAGLDAIVIGRSILVGKPMAQLLLAENCTVTMAHSRSRDLPEKVARADIVVAAVGQAEMIRGEWIKPGATVIDVGTSRVLRDGRTLLVGDVDFAAAAERARAITPVPGGVGPMTIMSLMHNTLVAACRRRGLPVPDLDG
ncbi:bifunctional methylenetetrahydrofolate dehydrogenase/methenyltetrahydrofolate cyclohydrolase FolD [Celeribacter indicus]|uniref:Bifunctional protein FolD n=1 Tax=Celeribacter indicus TaxID=1208324 RepID=A0A0B5E6M7_9RHOB|nr:bifunctional methylenetetrahydrofolate dehydrogenase/methenyltetrahydrofolate cyclohydrolase FolD [Celeribacter indicus]AJE49110.1 bifunctional 5,10-methylene-tetrahydrofolate dehydrogenase/ 5,10-methylene-tetrahydrofolate cyclohydrolase [Celeribacter indicus]SDX48597.1 methylenetetrahydrofolate dehydrogenase (NADP+) / methenyltetrahydrofolate cyclohydrolase [Celeribacter indicus]